LSKKEKRPDIGITIRRFPIRCIILEHMMFLRGRIMVTLRRSSLPTSSKLSDGLNRIVMWSVRIDLVTTS